MVIFKYERLGVFCYLCGLLGHTDDLCDKIFDLEEDNGERGWGTYLKTDTRMGGAGRGCGNQIFFNCY